MTNSLTLDEWSMMGNF